MINLTKFFILFLLVCLIQGCGDFRKIMTGQKIESTDEFLVKKKDPLILPPKYDELPKPNSNSNNSKNSSIQSILNSQNTTENPKAKSDLERMILKELKK
tara:strand:- start:2505 stop:2804 length:300 start_codon:yes stop_codon:yes gene_type:complete